MKLRLPRFLSLLTLLLMAVDLAADETGQWSKESEGVQARIILAEKPPINGTRWLVPYLELRNVSSTANPLKIPCDGKHVKFELVDGEGTVVRNGWLLPRSGPHADPGTIVLPYDSSIKISMTCRNWGIPKAAAMVATDSGAWVLEAKEKGSVYLRVTVTGEKGNLNDRIWEGKVSASVKVDWRK